VTSGGRPAQARSLATRAALLDAAIETLCAEGYGGATTAAIARRAGVSRGAQLHHFPTKAQLVAAAVEHLLDRRLADFRTAFVDAWPAGGDPIDAALDRLWTMFEGPAFVAWVELWVAARTDADLAATMVHVDLRFTEESRLLFVEIAARLEPADPRVLELLRDFSFAVMSGVTLQRLVPRGQRPPADYLDLLKRFVRSNLAAASVRERG
jgi:AcrR family transcriptional regulator